MNEAALQRMANRLDWAAYAEVICRTVASHDLPEHLPAYILNGDQLPPDLQDEGCLGIHATTMFATMQPHLEATGRWKGPGFATVVYPSRCRDEFEHPLGVAMHEFAHWCEGPLSCVVSDPQHREHLPTLMELVAAKVKRNPPTARGNESEPWHGHELPFIRASLHLLCRAMEAGFVWLSPNNMTAGGWQYNLSDKWAYWATLESEFAAKRNDPINEIVVSPPPAAMVELFERDKAAYHARHQNAAPAAA